MIADARIVTYTGEYVWPLEPWRVPFRIADIAHALSLQNRFSGHTREAYSVAEHSCHVCDLAGRLQAHGGWYADERAALAGLLHDAAEAYLVDLPRPLKYAPGFEAYRRAETRLMRVLGRQYGLPDELPASVHQADLVLLATERRDLMPAGQPWAILDGVQPLPERIRPWGATWAEDEFLRRFETLTKLDRVAA